MTTLIQSLFDSLAPEKQAEALASLHLFRATVGKRPMFGTEAEALAYDVGFNSYPDGVVEYGNRPLDFASLHGWDDADAELTWQLSYPPVLTPDELASDAYQERRQQLARDDA